VSRAEAVGECAARLRAHAAESGDESGRIITALSHVASRLSDPRDPLARELRAALHESTGLSAPMIDWGLTTTLASMRTDTLARLAARANEQGDALPLVGVVLAGNVFVAAVRALALPLLAGAHVLAKTASCDRALADTCKRALDEVDPMVGRRLELLHFARGDQAASMALCASVDALSVYGDDETVARLQAQLRPGATLIAHGHGVSAAYVHGSALPDLDAARQVARRLALDIAAYEQRGCLSPHFALVDRDAAVTPQTFARILADEALPKLAMTLPPGARTPDEHARAMQWRAVAAVRGALFDHPTHAVSFEGGNPPRPSPGGRLVSVYDAEDLSPLAGFGAHLKCLGVAADDAAFTTLTAGFAAIGGGYTCPVGEMQTPPFDAPADGSPPLTGLRATR
jgi:hypothetical protein